MSQLRVKLPDYLMQHGIDSSKKFLCVHNSHNDTNPSMSIWNSPSGPVAKCFSCSGGAVDIFTAASILDNCPLNGDEFITDNIFFLAKKFNIDTSGIGNNNGKYVSHAFKYNYIKAYKIVADFLQNRADEHPSEAFVKEIRKRKWAEKASIKLGVVCGCSFKDILIALKGAGFTDDFIKSTGLMRSDIFNNDNIIFTIYDEDSNPIAFYSRDTKYEEKKAEYDKRDFSNEIVKEKSPMKYNSSANCVGVYEKKMCPYGLHDVKNFHKIFAVEGHGCKHNLKLNGYDNVIALGGLELCSDTLDRLSSFGVTNIALFLDNDDKGIGKLKQIIKSYYGKSSIEFSVVDMSEYSDIKDPDELIRKHGSDTVKLLQNIHCLEWLAIKELEDTQDQYESAKTLSEFISHERSPVNRLKLINNISYILDVPVNIISEEVDQKIANSQDRKSEFAIKVLEEAKDLIRQNPNALNAAMRLVETKLVDLDSSDTNDDLFSSQEIIKGILALKEREESGKIEPIIKIGFHQFDKLTPLPTREMFGLILGPANTGKSALLLTFILNVLELNEDAMVIAYTNDDSRDMYINRLVAILANMPIKWVDRPFMYLDEEKLSRREAAFKKVMDYVLSEKLVIKDISHGSTVEYYGKLISFYRNKYQNRNIFSTCDNLHRLRTEITEAGDRERVKYISSTIKSFTTKYNCNCLCSVEMTKNNMFERITDCNAIAETASLQYDANLIIFLWNDLAAKRDEAEAYFQYDTLEYIGESDYAIRPAIGCLVEMIFLKNKISEFKGTIPYKLYPNISFCEEIPHLEFDKLIAINRKDRKVKEDKR
jgi:replicative DNA helicase